MKEKKKGGENEVTREKSQWMSVRVTYDDGYMAEISRSELERIAKIRDFIDAMEAEGS